jgi:histone chaperone ASF1
VQNNPAKFGDEYCFDITFECLEPLSKGTLSSHLPFAPPLTRADLEWKLTYVGSPDSDKYDQVLDSIMVGPIPVGVNRFQFTADPPQPEKVPASDLLGVTVILLTCAYDDKEFIRVGYYQHNEYPEGTEERRVWEEMMERKEKITKVDASKVVRNILADKPKVKRLNIKWYVLTIASLADDRDNPDGDEMEYPPPQELDGEIDREMDTDAPFIVPSQGAVAAVGEGTSKDAATAAVGGLAEDVDEGEELGSGDEEEEEEDDEGEDAEIDLDDEEEEEDDMAEDEDMAEAGDAGDDTMGSIEGPAAAHHPAS